MFQFFWSMLAALSRSFYARLAILKAEKALGTKLLSNHITLFPGLGVAPLSVLRFCIIHNTQ